MTIKTWQERSSTGAWTKADHKALMQAEIDELRAALDMMTTDRNEWKESTIMANTRFKQAEERERLLKERLEAWENQPAVATSTSRNTADFWTEIEVGTNLYTKEAT